MFRSISLKDIALTSIFAITTVGLSACGEDPETDTYTPPAGPSLYLSEAVVVFDVAQAGDTVSRSITANNGGTNDLIFSSISLDDTANNFTLTQPQSLTVGSLGSLSLDVSFDAPAPGISLAVIDLASNATDLAVAQLLLVGPVAQSPVAEGPDLAYFEDTTEVNTTTNQAYIRFFNLGERSLVITAIAIDGADYAFADGVQIPTTDVPVSVGPNSFSGYTIDYTGSGTGSATFTMTSHDPADAAGTEQDTTVEIIHAQ